MKKLLAMMVCLLMAAALLPAKAQAATNEVDMYRLYNPNSGEHFYTAVERERDALKKAGWRYEGTGWIAPSQGTAVYRLYNSNAGDHHYTLSDRERNYLISVGWKDEGIGWYSDPQLSVPVYREYNPNAKAGAHNYTASLKEHQALTQWGWKDEKIGWYALKEGTPVQTDTLSPLHVSGTQLLDADNQPVVLQGFSTFGLNYAPQYVDEGVFRFLKDTMHSQIIRLAIYTQEYGGYCSGGSQEQLKALIDKGVQAAEASGQYCIIDWHILSDGNPNAHINEAKAFFNEMSARYAGEDHVLYEICNEPNGTDWSQVRSYAGQIIPIIRSHDPDGVILVGTPTWSQDVDVAARNPLQGVSNVMYTLHFYAATHKDNIRDKLKTAHSLGLPVFVSEFGISTADGNGTLDPASGSAWISLLDQYGISRVGWSLSNKNESSALFLPGTSTNLSTASLSPAGQWFYQTYTKSPVVPGPSTPPAPAKPDQPLQTSVKQVNGWSEGDGKCVQFELTITNPNSVPVDGWSVEIPFNTSFSISNSWNGQMSVKGNTLTVQSVDYNSGIPAGSSVSSIGFILKTPLNAPDLRTA